MRIFRFLAVGIVCLFVGIGIYSVFQPQKTTEIITSIQNPTHSKVVTYSIDSFRERQFAVGTITIEREVRQTSTFTSSVVSFVVDGLKQYALMNVPTGTMPVGGFPVVIVNHGYIDPAIYSTENSYINTSAYYAQNGFLVLKPDYRGHDMSDGQARHFFSRIEYALDVATLVASLPSIPQANVDKVFMYGHSMGGDVTLRNLEMGTKITAASLWAPAVAAFPESHFYFVRKNRVSELPQSQAQLDAIVQPEDYHLISLLDNLSYVSTPLLIHHGTLDDSVPLSWSETLYQHLKNAGKQVTFYRYEGDNHDIGSNFSTALDRDIAFFKSFL